MKLPKNIFAVFVLVFAVAAIAYLAFSVKHSINYKIKFIEISGDVLLSRLGYLEFAKLNNKSNYESINVQIIKDRIEKHPYVSFAVVRYDGNGKVSVKITEKNIESLMFVEDEQYFITDKLQVLPVLESTLKIDYPVIANVKLDKAVKMMSSIKKNYDVMTAAKIIGTVKLANPEMHDALSSIDMQNGGEINIYFSTFDYPVKLGRGNELHKVIYFSSFWHYIKGNELNNYMDYVDLRYGG
ncbi:MAG: FtsQ-type POTRA domain-containing protein, partial [Bacteroidota bacterium]